MTGPGWPHFRGGFVLLCGLNTGGGHISGVLMRCNGINFAGAVIKFNNSLIIPDHGMIMVDDLAIGDELSCIAISQCCSLFPRLPEEARLGTSPSGIGSWLYPNGSYVLPTISDDSYGIVRHHGQVSLHRQSSGTAEGIWRCVVPGIHGGLDTVHIGIYSPGQGT